KALGDINNTQLREWEIEERDYRLAIGALQVGGASLGVFSVGLPTDFIVNVSVTSRDRYIPIFIVAAASVVVIGYIVSRFITVPLSQLVQASLAVSQGDLQRRTGVDSPDEIGTLAKTFDIMTESLDKRTEELQISLRRQRETTGRMEAILSSMGDGVLFEEIGGEIMPLNKAAEEMLIQMADNFMLGPLQELAAVGQDWAEEARKNPWLLDSRRFQVGERVFTVHSAAVRTDESERLGTVIVLRDITAEVEAERLKDAFVVHVSHELRTPLTVIKGYSALLSSMGEDSLDEKQKYFLEAILNNTDDLIMMVNTILDYSEIEAKGQLGLRPQSVDFSVLVREITDEWKPQMEDKGLDFDVEIPSAVPVVYADARRLRWVLVNIVRNACQYTPEGGSVDVKLSVNDGNIIVDVTDTGMGLSAEDQRRIFSRFYRVMKVQEDEKRGIGLGLYVSRAIAEAHGGELSLVSEVGAGSTFTFKIPIAQPDSESEKGN
ncbi:MAG: HAMP domain-containing protein, partial [Anaerolineae bacterium]|nr:HAMP domain-containing protein [Anaerolineae bacterium]